MHALILLNVIEVKRYWKISKKCADPEPRIIYFLVQNECNILDSNNYLLLIKSPKKLTKLPWMHTIKAASARKASITFFPIKYDIIGGYILQAWRGSDPPKLKEIEREKISDILCQANNVKIQANHNNRLGKRFSMLSSK